jgi:hypothetical protein
VWTKFLVRVVGDGWATTPWFIHQRPGFLETADQKMHTTWFVEKGPRLMYAEKISATPAEIRHLRLCMQR